MAFALAKTIFRFIRPPTKICPVQMTQHSTSAMVAPIDKGVFSETWKVFALRLPAKLCNDTRKVIKDHVLCIPRVKSVFKSENGNEGDKLAPVIHVLLKYFVAKPTSRYVNLPIGNCVEDCVAGSSSQVVEKLRHLALPMEKSSPAEEFLRNLSDKEVVIEDVRIDYSHWSIESVLRAFLPDGITIPSSFETVGHIAHLNLRDEHEPFKKMIGEVMLDKLGSRITSIVNKLQSTGGPYRTFAMEVLAGDGNMETCVKENGCRFRLNFSKVYWNSRLETEHNRMIRGLKADDILADAFCGIGPFTVPTAKQKRCKMVYANDLNPSSVHYLKQNVKMNRVDNGRIATSCSCARVFLKRLVQEEQVAITKVLMNFPAGAPEFLDVFRGLYKNWKGDRPVMPIVHCYCFVRGESEGVFDLDDARKRVRKALFGAEDAELDRLGNDKIDVREVRDVAPRKQQVCVTFQVPEFVAFLDGNNDDERPEKRRKVKGNGAKQVN